LPAGFKPDDPNSGYPGIFDHVLVPQLIDRVRGVDTVACGSAHTLVALNDGRLFVTGCNISGQVPLFPPSTLLTTTLHSWELVIGMMSFALEKLSFLSLMDIKSMKMMLSVATQFSLLLGIKVQLVSLMFLEEIKRTQIVSCILGAITCMVS
jgi:hypothetical protein